MARHNYKILNCISHCRIKYRNPVKYRDAVFCRIVFMQYKSATQGTILEILQLGYKKKSANKLSKHIFGEAKQYKCVEINLFFFEYPIANL